MNPAPSRPTPTGWLLLALVLLWGAPLAATTVEVCSSEGVDLVDADADGPGILDSVLTVDDEFFVNDVIVYLDIAHTWIGDLDISLTSPEETRNLLFSWDPEDESDDILVQFTDSGAAFGSEEWTCSCDVQPLSPMTSFRGETSDGDWTLTVTDGVSEDTGTLDTWCVTVNGCEVEPVSAPTCEVDDKAGTVTLSWFSPKEEADRINIYRDGDNIGDVETSATEFVDDEVGPGTHIYALGHESDDLECDSLSGICEVVVGRREWCVEPDLPIVSEADAVESTIVVEDVAGFAVVDVEMFVDISHAWVDELAVDVTNPEGTTTVLHDEFDTDGDPDILLTYSDSGVVYGSVALVCGCRVQPEGPGTMADLIPDATVDGDWILGAADSVALDDGTLNAWCLALVGSVETRFLRGDANGNGVWNNLADPLFLLKAGFIQGADQPPCDEAADINGNGQVQFIPDALYGLFFAFIEDEPAPPAPFPDCGTVDELEIGCKDSSGCD